MTFTDLYIYDWPCFMGMVAQNFLTHQKFRVLVVELLSSLLSLHSTSFTQGFLYM